MLKLDPRIILTLVISLTFISAELNTFFPPSLEGRLENGKAANILLIGIDARPDEINARSDTIMLLSINKQVKQAALISIPRDTRIILKGKNTKINMVNQLKGPTALCQEVSSLLDTEVEHYILTNFSNFKAIVDLLGGIYIDVDIAIQSPATGVYINKGYQCLNGQQALTYVRFRSDLDGDIGRIARQQRFMAAMADQIFSIENLPNLPGIVTELKKSVKTNLSLHDMIYISRLAANYNTDDLITQTLPGYHYWAQNSGASFWEADREIAHSLIYSLFHGHRYHTRLDQPPWVDDY